MSIAQQTTIQAYQLRKGGTRARMAILRMIAADSVHNANPHTRLQPGDWRGARSYTLGSYEAAYCTLDQGLQDGAPIWYCLTGPAFRGERFADECEGGPDHRGWFTNAEGETYKDGSGLARGIVGRLTHGRFVAGYHWGDNDERVYFPQVFDCERDAARMADEHARVFADSAREDSERFNAMQDAENEEEETARQLRKALALRHHPAGGMDEAREALQALRDAREALREATAAYERG